jgi:hypothetical protein
MSAGLGCRWGRQAPSNSMLVVVVTVGGVTVPVVDVVDVTVVIHGVVAAVRAVDVLVGRGHHVQVGDVALVDVPLVASVGVAVVEVVHVVAVLDGDVAAVGAVDVGVLFVDGAGRAHASFLGRWWHTVASEYRDVTMHRARRGGWWTVGATGSERVVRPSGGFDRVQDRVLDDVGHVLVDEVVAHVTAVAVAADEVGATEDGEVLGDPGLCDLEGRDQCRHVAVALRELADDRDPQGVRERAEDVGGAGERDVVGAHAHVLVSVGPPGNPVGPRV